MEHAPFLDLMGRSLMPDHSRHRLRFVPAAILLMLVAGTGVRAAVQDSVFFISPDGMTANFNVKDVSRREVLDRLFAGKKIRLEWRSQTTADEPITGVFQGPVASIARQLLAQTDFVTVYDGNKDHSRITRVVIIGKSMDKQTPSADASAIGSELSGTVANAPNANPAAAYEAGLAIRPLTPAELAEIKVPKAVTEMAPAIVPVMESAPQILPPAGNVELPLSR